MRRLILAALGAGVLSFIAAAYASGHGEQGTHGPFERGHRGMHGLMFERALDLSAEQKAAIEEIYSASQAQRNEAASQRRSARQAMMALNPGDADYQEKVAALAKQQAALVENKVLAHGDMQAQVYQILTSEQRAEFEDLKQAASERMARRGPRFDRYSE